ncbi:Methyltransferase domain-containing protein [Paucidesulfovibrio gracilis DSM 16080]|uniref:Methyltransferase domain-containing protein n=1 Tax=Paucidesulfovibrio gracilis DSM 16080 TaxID=1121449 RepID=A0A1T4X0Z0_9BACT|nr:class I SAM-dependent methyltransferase [Paucidesulfovibrio gracilis]SKA83097.1 Methyltransferase domain-containing protein [Paucidesulfovibrio gracilis DSM 16080]
MIAMQEHLERSLDAVSLGLIPPQELAIQFGGGDFVRIGRNLLHRLVDWCGLLPSERILDVGCGAGRAAVPLTGYLSPHARYFGFDVYPFGVDWCRQNLTPAFPNFLFQTVHVNNALYNPAGSIPARDFVFPCEDRSADLVLLNSVFTHMLPEDMIAYMKQIARVLDHCGRAYVTWFLIDDESRRLDRETSVGVYLRHGVGPCRLQNRQDPEEAIGYDISFVHHVVRHAGLRLADVRRGSWRGIRSGHYQDVTILEKSGENRNQPCFLPVSS